MGTFESASLRALGVLDALAEPVRLASSVAPLSDLVKQCYAQPRASQYHSNPGVVRSLTGVAAAYGDEIAAAVAQALLAELIHRFQVSRLPFRVSEKVEQFYLNSFLRILSAPKPCAAIDDSFLKDVALASGRLFPAGERVVEPYSALQRSLVSTGGLSQSLRFISALMSARGNAPVFRMHVHLSEASRLSGRTWRDTCLTIAEMVAVNKAIRGVVGASWFYAPSVVSLAPHLRFVRDELADAGVYWFFSHQEGRDSGALLTSERRKQAFCEGRFIPECYVMFWPRKNVLSWLARMDSSN